ncbi:hypothetical protein [Halochromatium roseum]|uniref:hypothetical protein n=1 Tax=Halochromatium roseum TaxID=391920 RepID=UPI001911B7E0|nr:hypothetical protein [Halochromatium roseum]MBK5941412.1 hypothetical protein [Halochromatium roseum]
MGQLGFEIRVVSAHGAGQQTEVALLSDDQAAFVLLLTRNTERVVEFKYRLVMEFRRMRKLIAKLYANPPRQDALKGKREAHEPMMNALKAYSGLPYGSARAWSKPPRPPKG